MKRIKELKINWYYATAFLLLLGFIGINLYNANNQTKVVEQYRKDLTREDITEQRYVADEYNKTVENNEVFEMDDIYADDYVESDLQSSVNLFNDNEPIGSVEVPSLDLELAIYEGTSEQELQLGAGHMKGTSLPTGENNTRSVITAHRGLTTKRMFRDIDKLEIGDIFFIESFGEKKAYEVYNKDVVLPENSSSVDLIPDEEVVTLLTCEPYMLNTHRLLVDGRRVDYEESMDKQKKKGLSFSLVDIEYLILIAVGILIVGKVAYELYKKKKED